MTDQWTEVDERFDKEFWFDCETGEWCETTYDPECNNVMDNVKKFLHSELEKVRQETIEEVKSIAMGENLEEDGDLGMISVKWFLEELEAISINKKDK